MDYCTLWFEGWWSRCCAAHDGAYAAQVVREVADAALATCVAGSLPAFVQGSPTLTVLFITISALIAGAMWLAVRVFGLSFYTRAP